MSARRFASRSRSFRCSACLRHALEQYWRGRPGRGGESSTKRSLHDVKVRSVKKKLKSKSFAASVNRDDIREGAEELGVPLDEHIEFVLQALCGIADELGLAGDNP